MMFPERRVFRKRKNYLTACATELLNPALQVVAAARSRSKSLPPGNWRKALIVGGPHIGDLLYRSASLPHLKKGLPQCEFFYLTSPGAGTILDGNPGLAGILPFRRSDSTLDLSPESVKALKNHDFDAILCTSEIRLWPDLLLGLKLGIPARVAYAHRGLTGLISHKIKPVYPSPFPCYFREMVSAITGLPPTWAVLPQVFLEAGDTELVGSFLDEAGCSGGEPIIACFVTTRQPSGSWPEAWFGRVLRIVRSRNSAKVVLCGTVADKNKLAAIRSEFCPDAVVNAGRFPLKALVAFLSRCAVTLTQDSGPRHMSTAARTPSVFTRNINVDAIETGTFCDLENDLVPAGVERIPEHRQKDFFSAVSPELAAERVLAVLASKKPMA